MKYLLTLATMALVLCFTTPTLAQTFNGFNLTDSDVETALTCVKLGGSWHELGAENLPNVQDIDGGAVCSFKKQVVKQLSDTSFALITPDFISFTFVGNKVEFAIFDYGFPTWAHMDLAKQSVQRHMNRLFPLTVSKVESNRYKLNNTKFFLEFMTAVEKRPVPGKVASEEVFHLALGISRDRMEIYLVGDPLEDEDSGEMDDPLRGFDHD